MSGYNLGVAVGGFARLIQDHFGIYPKCFTEKLIPWLKEMGAEPIETDWDW